MNHRDESRGSGGTGARRGGVPAQSLRYSRAAFFLSVMACYLAPCAAALGAITPQPVYTLSLAGSDRILWAAMGEWDSDREQFLTWLAWTEPDAKTVSPLWLPAQIGQPRAWAELDGDLYLFLLIQQGRSIQTAHYSYSKTNQTRRERRLPDDALPMALAGDSSGGTGLWAVVDGRTAEAIKEEFERDQETQPAPDTGGRPEAGKTPSVASRAMAAPPPEGLFLVRYDGTNWRPGFECPPEIGRNGRIWLVVSGPQHHLFWQRGLDDNQIQYARHEKEGWAQGPAIRFARPVEAGFAGVLNKQLLFAAILEEEGATELHCEPQVLSSGGDRWDARPALKTADGQKVVSLPRGSVVSALKGKLALMKMGAKGPELGLWSPADGRQELPFTDVPVKKVSQMPSQPSRRQEILSLLVVTSIVLLVYWRRRDTVNLPVLLPPGATIADLGRRTLAALIDMAPAGLVVMFIWRVPLADYFAQLRSAAAAQQPTQVPPAAGLTWTWIWFVLLYTFYCTAFELRWSATPGKRLFKCVVAAENLERPMPVQIVVRNAARLLELGYLQITWPFLLVILMTRNRQRIGDLLARTIVVDRRGVPEGVELTEGAEMSSPRKRRGDEGDEG